jgi:Predicted O-methyltransferase
MQQMWTDIDRYIDSHLIPEDPILNQTLENTAAHGFPDHLAVAPNQGMLLQMLIQMNKCKRILELGTFAAYSTMWLARALPEDGYILTIEGRETHAAMGQENIDRAQLKQKVELKCGRAADVLRALPEDTEAFDFIFIDADKQSYPEYLELSLNLSHSGTIIFLDNVIRAGDIINPDNKNQVLKAFVTCLKRWKIIHVSCLVLLYRPLAVKAMMVLHSQLSNNTTRTKISQ